MEDSHPGGGETILLVDDDEDVRRVTSRLPEDGVYHDLIGEPDALAAAGIESVTRIGDCHAPATIAAAVHSGHRFARELDAPTPGHVPFRRERTAIGEA